METDIIEQCNKFMNDGAPVLELFIYSTILRDDRGSRLSDSKIKTLIEQAVMRYNYAEQNLEEIIDRLLDGDEEDWY